MPHYLLLAVIVNSKGNPFRPLSYINLGHVDVTLWSPPQLPSTFGFYPESLLHAFVSAFVPQKARLIRSKRFTRIPAYWQYWDLPKDRFLAVEEYLDKVTKGCVNGSVRYDALHFNCLHLAYSCMETAGLNPPSIPVQRVWFAKTIVPHSFIHAVMSSTHYSIVDHDLDYRNEMRVCSI